jgi:hypothetical protein
MTLLDAVAGPILLIFPLVFIFLFVGIVFLEAWIISKIQKISYKKGLRLSFYANGASLLAGIFLVGQIGDPSRIDNFLAYFAITLVIETGVLVAVTKGKEWKSVTWTSVLMNIASYVLIGAILFTLETYWL